MTLDDQPLAGALIVFLNDDAEKEMPLTSQSDADGNYKLMGNQKRGGVLPGRYKAMVRKDALKASPAAE